MEKNLRGQRLGLVENRTGKNMEHEMKSGIISWFVGIHVSKPAPEAAHDFDINPLSSHLVGRYCCEM